MGNNGIESMMVLLSGFSNLFDFKLYTWEDDPPCHSYFPFVGSTTKHKNDLSTAAAEAIHIMGISHSASLGANCKR